MRLNPSKAALLEEFLHGTQSKLGIIEKLGQSGAEAHVKDFMIRHQNMLGLSIRRCSYSPNSKGHGTMRPTFPMTVSDVFAVGDKLIFTGGFKQCSRGEIKGLVEIFVDGSSLGKIQIEGEVFNNKPEVSLWAKMPSYLSIEILKGKEVILASVQ